MSIQIDCTVDLEPTPLNVTLLPSSDIAVTWPPPGMVNARLIPSPSVDVSYLPASPIEVTLLPSSSYDVALYSASQMEVNYGHQGIPGPAGEPGVTWTGVWSSSSAYAVNDAVTYNGSSYRALVAISSDTVAFTPGMVADLVLAADTITGLNDGALVLSWPGTGKTTSYSGVAVSATAPIYKTAILNGRPVLRFPGNQLIKVLSIAQTAGMSMITVARLNAATAYAMIMTYNPPGGWELRANGSTFQVQYIGGGGYSVSPTGSVLDSWHILEGIENLGPSLAELYVDGTSLGNIGTTAAVPTADLWMGQRSDGYPMNGDIAEAIMVCADLSVSDRQKIEGYLADKYGLQANLPAGHPYKSAPPLVSGTPSPPDQNPTVWELMAKAGDPGPQGPAGLTKSIWGETPVGAINGTNLNYASANPYSPGLLSVYLNGLRLRRSADYNETGSQSFQFFSAPLPGDSLSIDYIQP
jgi:hypothetical protein